MTMERITLSRQVRFGLHEAGGAEVASANGFAAHPALLGMAPFLTLTARVSGPIDPATGMVINIKLIDEVLRKRAVPLVRDYYYAAPRNGPRGGADLLLTLGAALAGEFKPCLLSGLELALSPYLRLAGGKEKNMVELTQRFEFSAAHRLHCHGLSAEENRRVFGKCNNLNGHGHNYELEVTVGGVPDGTTGAVFPVAQLQSIVNRRVVEVFDHKHLNLDCGEFKEVNPTVENIAKVIFEKLRNAFAPVRLTRVKVWETPKTFCEYGG